MEHILDRTFAAIFIALMIVFGLIGAVVFIDGRSGKTESFYTESAHEARVFSRECLDRPDSVLGVLEHSFGAWELFCKWSEE